LHKLPACPLLLLGQPCVLSVHQHLLVRLTPPSPREAVGAAFCNLAQLLGRLEPAVVVQDHIMLAR
jgi:hypothetical protein